MRKKIIKEKRKRIKLEKKLEMVSDKIKELREKTRDDEAPDDWDLERLKELERAFRYAHFYLTQVYPKRDKANRILNKVL